MRNKFISLILVLLLFSSYISSQDFSDNAYLDFRQSILGISETQLENIYTRSSDIYLKGFENAISFDKINYLDSVI